MACDPGPYAHPPRTQLLPVLTHHPRGLQVTRTRAQPAEGAGPASHWDSRRLQGPIPKENGPSVASCLLHSPLRTYSDLHTHFTDGKTEAGWRDDVSSQVSLSGLGETGFNTSSRDSSGSSMAWPSKLPSAQGALEEALSRKVRPPTPRRQAFPEPGRSELHPRKVAGGWVPTLSPHPSRPWHRASVLLCLNFPFPPPCQKRGASPQPRPPAE